MNAASTFTVDSSTTVELPDGLARAAMDTGVLVFGKTYSGGLSGRSTTIFTSAYDPASGVGTYVALETFEGMVDGRTGAFSFLHSASTSGADRSDEVFRIVPSSGSGELAGIAGGGSLTIDADGTHRVRLDYDLG